MDRTAYDKMVADACNCTPKKGVSIDELQAMNCQNSKIITLSVANGTGATASLVLGTPIGNPLESDNYATEKTRIGNPIATDAPTSAAITDNRGVGATFIAGLNQRFMRNPIFVNNIKVVTDSDAQRQESVQVIEVPYNSASDSRLKAQEFIPVDTEYTGIVNANQGAVLGEFYGIVYDLLDGVTTKFNIEIAAHDVANFKSC